MIVHILLMLLLCPPQTTPSTCLLCSDPDLTDNCELLNMNIQLSSWEFVAIKHPLQSLSMGYFNILHNNRPVVHLWPLSQLLPLPQSTEQEGYCSWVREQVY